MSHITSVDEAFADAVARRQVAGIVALAETADGKTLYEAAEGVRDLNSGAPISADSVFWFASMTKAVTSICALQLVEKGLIGLDQPIGDIMPELAEPKVLAGFDVVGKPKFRAAARPITLRHLLTHTSGFIYDIWSAEMMRCREAMGAPGVIGCQNAALTLPLAFDPGERWDYGIGIDWVGKTIEKLSGQRLSEYMAAHIFEPLGMRDTAFKITPAMRARLVTMHARGEDGGLVPIEFELPQEPEFEMGGGGLYSTAGDYMKFCQAILHGGAPLLQPETMKLVYENQIGPTRVGLLKTAVPGHSNDAEFFPGLEKAWTAAFMTNLEDAPTGRSAGSLAWAGLGNTYHWIDRTKGVAGVICTQTLPFADTEVLRLFDTFERGVYAALH
jgi:methyl acetate hydrolase